MQEPQETQVQSLGQKDLEGCGNPLQYPCLENPMNRGAWWAIVHGVTKSRTWLKQLSIYTLLFNNATDIYWPPPVCQTLWIDTRIKRWTTSEPALEAVSWVTWRQLHQQRTAGQREVGEGRAPARLLEEEEESGDGTCLLQVSKGHVPPCPCCSALLSSPPVPAWLAPQVLFEMLPLQKDTPVHLICSSPSSQRSFTLTCFILLPASIIKHFIYLFTWTSYVSLT